MNLHDLLNALALASPVLSTITSTPRASKPASLQDIVTYDADSLFVKGERIFMLAGEYAPFRHPVPSVWLDAFEKVKALGFNAISFYVAWFLVEGKHGDLSVEGVFDLKKLFEAATQAGAYLIARPGPYIRTETSGDGLLGWL